MTGTSLTEPGRHWLAAFANWVWTRHHNKLSWYIRPMFLLPLAYFSYARSLQGIAGTLIATLSSMFWFPEPKTIDPRVAAFLQMEREYLTRHWGPRRMVLAGLPAACLASFCAAFWLRSLGLGALVLNAMWCGKVGWSLVKGKNSGRAILRPALMGLVTCDALLLGSRALLGRRRRSI